LEGNVEIVRWLHEEGYARRTVDSPGAEDRVSADYRFHPRPGFPGRSTYRLDEMVEFWADLDATLIDHSLIPQSYEPIGSAHVLVTLRQTARVRGSKRLLTEIIYMLWHLVDGRARETWTSTGRVQVLEAAGLSE
jgi:hypothetical protein